MRTPFCLLAALVAVPAAAQSEAYVDQAIGQANVAATVDASALDPFEALEALLPTVADGTNVLVLTQSGTGNTIDAQQIGLDNRVALTQTGDRNAFVLTQDGDDNLILARVDGSDNGLITVTQSDDGNVYALELVGDFAPAHTVTQTGGGNLATQIVGPGSTPVDIQQFGQGIEVIVERN